MADVLIVDDEQDSREYMSLYLQKFGHHVRCAPNGTEAIAALSSSKPDVIILDWMMPKMDGITFLEIIRSYLNWAQLPVVLVTAYNGPHIDKAKSLGVEGVFLKGNFALPALQACVNKADKKHHPDA